MEGKQSDPREEWNSLLSELSICPTPRPEERKKPDIDWQKIVDDLDDDHRVPLSAGPVRYTIDWQSVVDGLVTPIDPDNKERLEKNIPFITVSSEGDDEPKEKVGAPDITVSPEEDSDEKGEDEEKITDNEEEGKVGKDIAPNEVIQTLKMINDQLVKKMNDDENKYSSLVEHTTKIIDKQAKKQTSWEEKYHEMILKKNMEINNLQKMLLEKEEEINKLRKELSQKN